MKYGKRIVSMLIIFSILIEVSWQASFESDATVISKEVEWNIQCLNAEMSYEDSKNLSRVKVAVLDSGLDTDKDIPYVERKDFLGDFELNMMRLR